MEKLHKTSRELYDELKGADRELKLVTTELEKLTKQKEFLQTEGAEYDKIKARMDLQFRGSKAALTSDSKKRSAYLDELSSLKKEIAKSQKTLDKIQPKFAKAQQQEQEAKEKYDTSFLLLTKKDPRL
jgi:chromosome segregation ATPase